MKTKRESPYQWIRQKGKNMQKVVMMGRLGKSCELRYANGANGQFATTNGSIFVQRNRPNADGEYLSDVFNFSAVGRNAEKLEKIGKGKRVILAGRFQNNEYVNRNGEKVRSIQLMVEQVEYVDFPEQNQNNQQAQPGAATPGAAYGAGATAPSGYQNAQQQMQPQPGLNLPTGQGMPVPGLGDGFMNIPDGLEDQLPFA